MHQAWKIRLLFALFALGLASYFVYPTVVYFSLGESELKDVRTSKEAFEKYVPSWASTSHIVAGLDLQGGIHLVLGVDIDKALFDRVTRAQDRLKEIAKDEKLQFLSVKQLDGVGEKSFVKVEFESADELAPFEKQVFANLDTLVLHRRGGTSLTLKLNPNLVRITKRDSVDQAINTIGKRIDKMGVTEPSIAKRGTNQIQIQLPGYDDPKEAKKLIGRTAQLEFMRCDDDTDFMTRLKNLPANVELVKSGYGRPGGGVGKDIYLQFFKSDLDQVREYLKERLPEGRTIRYGEIAVAEDGKKLMRTYTLFNKIELTGDDLVDAHVSQGQESPRPLVVMAFNAVGGKIFERLSGENIGKRFAIVLEEFVDSAPVIQSKISGGRATINMGGARSIPEMLKDANQLALVLKSGALPAPVTFQEERSVGPSLGADSVKNAKNAFMVGGLLIALFMLFYYRMAGVISLIGLVFNITFVLAALSFLGATITLPGVAGLLLTVGMAVDANIIIIERIREELRKGKMPRSAVHTGYDAAFSAVMDANITTFIAGVVLWQYGTGPIQNFATMLIIGTLFSVISAIFVTRIFFDILTSRDPKTLSV